MFREKILEEVKALKLPTGEYLVSGSGALAVRNIRAHKDIDLVLSDELFKNLKEKHGWKVSEKYRTTIESPDKRVEGKVSLEWMSTNPALKDLLPRADYFEQVPFLSLRDLLESKKALGREKDKNDILVILDILTKKE